NQRCDPVWSERELQHKLEDAFRHANPRKDFVSRASYSQFPRKAKVKIDPATVVEKFLQGFRCDEVDLWEASPMRPPDDWTQDAVVLLENLYLPGEQINYVTSYKLSTKANGAIKAAPFGIGATDERDMLITRWRELMPQSKAGGWLRMNPMDGRGGADVNVTAFRFALIECDAIPVELQMPLLAKLPLPVAAILSSGGRSLHAWVRINAANAEDFRHGVSRILALLAKFGVDTANKNPARMSRLPGVVRQIGAEGDGRQRLFYLNARPIQKAIL
ncbi:MAG: hypothetical protein ABSF34_16370, partial [Verrucomicrobiota bacterium]